ncbi:hypothetical protein KY289_009073 [Solanum tuberosum]|nr:hypothetical protein KY289_009073 [Solanum tuberosum]
MGEIPAEPTTLPVEDSMMGESPAELPTLPVEDSTNSSGSLAESLSSWISNPNSITDALELEKSTTTGDAFDFYPATQTETTDETVVFGSKDIIDPGPPVCDSEIEAEEEQQGEPVWDNEPEEGERQIIFLINLDRIEEPANQQLNAEITEEQQLNAEITEEQNRKSYSHCLQLQGKEKVPTEESR